MKGSPDEAQRNPGAERVSTTSLPGRQNAPHKHGLSGIRPPQAMLNYATLHPGYVTLDTEEAEASEENQNKKQKYWLGVEI